MSSAFRNFLIVVVLAIGGYYLYNQYQQSQANGTASTSGLGSFGDGLQSLSNSLGSLFSGGSGTPAGASTNPTGVSTQSAITSPSNTAPTTPSGNSGDQADDSDSGGGDTLDNSGVDDNSD